MINRTTIWLILSIVLFRGWIMKELEVNNAFLNGDLLETVYKNQSSGFINPMFPHHVCKLIKAFYGLKQAPRAWFVQRKTFLLAHGFVTGMLTPLYSLITCSVHNISSCLCQ